MEKISRIIKLLTILSNTNDYIPSKYFSEKFDISNKTLLKDIDDINEYGENYGVFIYKQPSQGIKLEGNINNISKLKKKILEKENKLSVFNRRIYIIRNILVFDNNLSIEDLSENFMVSKSSIYNDINFINKCIQNKVFDVYNNNIYFIGNEFDKQLMIKKVFYFLYESKKMNMENILLLFFEKNIINKINNIFNDCKIENYISESYLESFFLTTLILIIRVSNNRHMESIEYNFPGIEKRNIDLFNKFVEKIEKEFSIELTENDYLFFKNQASAHGLLLIDEFQPSYNKYEKLVEKIIIRFSRVVEKDFTNNYKLKKALLLHIPPMINRLKNNIYINLSILKNIKIEYQKTFRYVWYSIEIIESEYNVLLNDNEVSLLVLHFQLALEDKKERNKIWIVCQYGKTLGKFIYLDIKDFLPKDDVIEIKNIEDIKNYKKESVDLIISSVDIKEEIEVPVVKVSNILTEENYIDIIFNYKKYLIDNHNLNKNYNIVRNYLNEDLIYVKQNYNSKNELIDWISNELLDKKFVSKDYNKSVKTREELGNTGFYSGIALPHANTNTILKSHISIITLRKPIVWSENKIYLVVLLNLTENDFKNDSKIIDELYEIITNKNEVEHIRSLENKDKIIKYFNGRQN